MKLKPKKYISLLSRNTIAFLIFLAGIHHFAGAQCLSAVNPMGGNYNLLVQEKKTLRFISFYRYNFGDRYFEGDQRSDFNLIRDANYNYAGTVIGYGVSDKITLETELGYFINKTQHYRLEPPMSLQGSGLSNSVMSLKTSLFKNNEKRFFISAGCGVKIPFSREPIIRKGVELPVEVQPTSGSYGTVTQFFIVKENTASGTRYFLTGRMEYNFRNPRDYKPGTSAYTSLFYSKHLMFPWLKGDWTAIFQIRNELRGKDRTESGWKASSGSSILFFSPQINTLIHERWNISAIFDIPVYQYFKGTQLATRFGASLNFARDFKL
jgi:hypothetical protein